MNGKRAPHFNKKLLLIGTVFIVLFMTMGYSALNSNLSISGDAYVRVEEDIRITNLKVLETTNGAYENYSSKYSKDTTSVFVTLPNLNSTITYEGTVINKDNKAYKVKEIKVESATNPMIKYEVIGLTVDDIINGNTEIKFQIKQTYDATLPDNKTNDLVIKYVFEKDMPGLSVDDIIVSLNAKTKPPDFNTAATTSEGAYATNDGMYGGTSYYYRGAVENNWVKFGGFYWRIIRFNGDKTVRMIYQGKATNNPVPTGTETQIEVSKYNSSSGQSAYVGYTYLEGVQRSTGGTSSTIKELIDTWYTNNLASQSGRIADGKYCNDRNTASGESWSSAPVRGLHYAGYERLNKNKNPTLSCGNSEDIYTLKAGLITVDEAAMAGAVYNIANSNYYLYTGQYYWTMSPWGFDGNNANVFYVGLNGSLGSVNVASNFAVRPVINLKADTVFTGEGTLNNPYVVK